MDLLADELPQYWQVQTLDKENTIVLTPYHALPHSISVCTDSAQVISLWQECILPAKSVFVATGAVANVVYSYEYKNQLQRQGCLRYV